MSWENHKSTENDDKCVMIGMNATNNVAMNFTMIMDENNRWCKMKNGSRDSAKWNMAGRWCKMKMATDGAKMRMKTEDAK